MRTLGWGQFYGALSREMALPNMVLALRRADVPAEDVAEHCHAGEAHFILAIDPGYRSTAAGAPVSAEGPLLVYNPPGTVHRDCFAGRSRHYLSLSLDAAWLGRQDLALPASAATLGDAGAMALANRLTGHCIAGSDAFDAESHCLALLARTTSTQDEGAPARSVRRAIEFMRAAPASVSVQAIASACGLHPVYLARAFRRATGWSPVHYRNAIRLERASAWLRHSLRTLAVIAQDAGFADQSHMTRAFRAAFGVTPKAYRAAFS